MQRFVQVTGVKGKPVPGGWGAGGRRRFLGKEWLPKEQWDAANPSMDGKLRPITEVVILDKIVSDAIAGGELIQASDVFVAPDLADARAKAAPAKTVHKARAPKDES